MCSREDYRPGDLGVIFDDQKRLVGVGLLDPSSPLRLRILFYMGQEEHVKDDKNKSRKKGKGGGKKIDETFWRDRAVDAAARRPSFGQVRYVKYNIL